MIIRFSARWTGPKKERFEGIYSDGYPISGVFINSSGESFDVKLVEKKSFADYKVDRHFFYDFGILHFPCACKKIPSFTDIFFMKG